MEIRLRGVKRDSAKVRTDLMSAFVVSPMVIIEDESDAGGTIRATVVYQRGDTHDRTSVASIIDTVIMRNGFLFCSIDHCDEPLEVAGGWPLLE